MGRGGKLTSPNHPFPIPDQCCLPQNPACSRVKTHPGSITGLPLGVNRYTYKGLDFKHSSAGKHTSQISKSPAVSQPRTPASFTRRRHMKLFCGSKFCCEKGLWALSRLEIFFSGPSHSICSHMDNNKLSASRFPTLMTYDSTEEKKLLTKETVIYLYCFVYYYTINSEIVSVLSYFL